MTKFERRLDVDAPSTALPNYPILQSLLQEWQLPGTDTAMTHLGLRLAVRNGYLNFYAKGQSVAKLSIRRGSPILEVHRAYVTRQRSEGYLSYSTSALSELTNDDLSGWAREALKYAGEEKRFIDDLVTANAGTIDLEMGLPGDPRVANGGKMVAPRLDLVVVQDSASGLELAFWEAKCADNSEIRAREIPHVVGQLQNYVRWLRLVEANEGVSILPHRGKQVLDAYRSAARTLVELAAIAEKEECAAIRLWKRAAAESLNAVVQPAVVIGSYCPEHDQRTALLRRKAESFESNGHRAKLETTHIEQAIKVVEYSAAPLTALPLVQGQRLTPSELAV